MKMFGLLFWLCVLLIGYVYAGYPLLVAFLARWKRNTPAYPIITPQVSILIAAYNEEGVIAGKIENTLALEYPEEYMQIVVAVDGSDDRTVEIVQSFEDRGVEMSYQSLRAGKAAAINRAIPLLKHEIVVFSDANNLYTKETLLELVRPFCDPKIGAVTGSKLILDDMDAHAKADGLYWRYESAIKKNETRLGSCTGVVGEILAFRKALYQPPPPGVINDDFFIGMSVLRQGYRLVYVPEARSYERSSLTEHDEAIRRSRIVAGRYQALLMANRLLPWRDPMLVWQIVSHKFMRPLVPLLMIAAKGPKAAATAGELGDGPLYCTISHHNPKLQISFTQLIHYPASYPRPWGFIHSFIHTIFVQNLLELEYPASVASSIIWQE